MCVVIVPQLMDTQLETWMDAFHKFLTLPDIPALEERDQTKESVLDGVRCAVCNNINLVRECLDAQPYLPIHITILSCLCCQAA